MTRYRATAQGHIEMTPEEEEAFIRDYQTPAPKTKQELNAPILAALAIIDLKTIRALREGNNGRINELEIQASILRSQLTK